MFLIDNRGDIIQEVDGKVVTKTNDVFAALSMEVGQTLEITVARSSTFGDKILTVKLTTAPDTSK